MVRPPLTLVYKDSKNIFHPFAIIELAVIMRRLQLQSFKLKKLIGRLRLVLGSGRFGIDKK